MPQDTSYPVGLTYRTLQQDIYRYCNRMLPPTAYLISPRTPTSHMNESRHISIRHGISCWLMYRILQQDTAQTGLGSTEGASYEGTCEGCVRGYEGTPLRNANGPAAGGSTSKYGGSTSKPMQAILFSSFTQVLQLFVTLHAHLTPPTFTAQLFPDFLFFPIEIFVIFGLFLLTFFNLIFFIPAGWPNFFLASLNLSQQDMKILRISSMLRIPNILA